MFHRRWLFAVGMLFVLGWVCPVLAAEAGQTSDRQSGAQVQRQRMPAADQAQMGQAHLQKAKEVIGKDVKNPQGDNLGKIHDIVLTPDHNSVSYAVLAHGGVLGMGEKYFAIPWSAFDFTTTADTLTLNISKDELDKAEGFDKDNWPQQADMRWSRGGEAQQQTMREPSARQAQTADMKFRKCSELMGADVKNKQNETLGSINDVIIDTQQRQGHVVYGIVSYGGVLGMGEKLVAVPWNAIDIDPSAKVARLDSTKQDLEAIAFTSDSYPDLADRSYARRVADHFGTEPYWEVYGYVPGEEGGAAARWRAWRANSEYNRNFKADASTSLSGTVESVTTFTPATGAAEGTRLMIKGEDGQTMTVDVGPQFYLQQKQFSFQNGDSVRITGSKTSINGRTVIMVTQITKGDKTLQLRDSQGRPQWESAIPSEQQQQQQPGRMESQQPGRDSQRPSNQGGSDRMNDSGM